MAAHQMKQDDGAEAKIDIKQEEGEEPEGSRGEKEAIAKPPGSDLIPLARNQCPHCFTQFALEKTYVDHMWTAHGSRRPFRCDDCGIFLSYRSSLYNHRKIHSDKRPFACTDCNAKFRWNNSLKYHMSRAHQKSVTAMSTRQSRKRGSQKDSQSTPADPTPALDADAAASTPLDTLEAARLLQFILTSSTMVQQESSENAAGQSAGSPESGQGQNSNSHDFPPEPPKKASRKSSKPRHIPIAKSTTSSASNSTPRNKTGGRLEPKKCHGCNQSFFLPEALEAHLKACPGPEIVATREDDVSSAAEVLAEKRPPFPTPSPATSGLPRLSAAESYTANGAFPFPSPPLTGASTVSKKNVGMAKTSDFLAEQLRQISAQQETLLRRLEGFERWAQEKIGNIESLVVALVAVRNRQNNDLNGH